MKTYKLVSALVWAASLGWVGGKAGRIGVFESIK
jgi:hypothetical protein